jgi:hypothetical protein
LRIVWFYAVLASLFLSIFADIDDVDSHLNELVLNSLHDLSQSVLNARRSVDEFLDFSNFTSPYANLLQDKSLPVCSHFRKCSLGFTEFIQKSTLNALLPWIQYLSVHSPSSSRFSKSSLLEFFFSMPCGFASISNIKSQSSLISAIALAMPTSDPIPAFTGELDSPFIALVCQSIVSG